MADGSVTIEVTLTKDQLEKGLKSIKSDLNSLSKINVGSALNALGNVFDSVGKKIVSVGKTITLATVGMVASLGTAIGRFDTLKNYPKVLSNLGFSAEEAEEAIKELSDGIDGLPTGLNDAASGVQRLVAKNGDIKKSTKYFLAMNDAIVAGNAPTEQQSSAKKQLTQAYSKGKFDLMEWRTLMMAMPGQLKQIAIAMGYVDTDGLYEALQKGRISMDEFMDTVVELDKNGAEGIKSFQEQAHNSCDSIGTAITNLGNRFKKGFASILESLDETAKSTSFGSIAGIINKFSESIVKFLNKVGDAVKRNETVKKTIENMAGMLENFDKKINGLSDEQLDKIITFFVNLAKLGPALIIFGKIFSIIGVGITNLSGIISAFGEGGAISSIEGVLASLGISSSTFLGVAGGVLAGLTAIIGLIVGAYKNSDKLRNSISKTIELIKNKVKEIYEKIQPSLERIKNTFKESIDRIKESLGGLGDSMSSYWDKYGPAMIEFFSKMIVKGVEFASIILEKVVPVITTVITFIINLFTTVYDVATKITGIFSNATTETIKTKNMIVNGISSFIDFFKNIPERIGFIIEEIIKWLKQLPSRIWGWLQDSINKVIEWGNNLSQRGSQAVTGLISNIENIIKELPGKMFNWGKDMIQGMINGITSMSGKIEQTASNIGNRISQYIHFSRPDKGPLREYEKWMPDMMKGLATSLKGSESILSNETERIANEIAGNFELKKIYDQMQAKVNAEAARLSTNITVSSNMSRVINLNAKFEGSVDIDKQKTGRILAPEISKVIKAGGLA